VQYGKSSWAKKIYYCDNITIQYTTNGVQGQTLNAALVPYETDNSCSHVVGEWPTRRFKGDLEDTRHLRQSNDKFEQKKVMLFYIAMENTSFLF